MNHSPVYMELESMIQKNWMVQSLAEFGQELERLEKEGKISTQERSSLIELYVGKSRQAD
jgi:hypothetical protein